MMTARRRTEPHCAFEQDGDDEVDVI